MPRVGALGTGTARRSQAGELQTWALKGTGPGCPRVPCWVGISPSQQTAENPLAPSAPASTGVWLERTDAPRSVGGGGAQYKHLPLPSFVPVGDRRGFWAGFLCEGGRRAQGRPGAVPKGASAHVHLSGAGGGGAPLTGGSWRTVPCKSSHLAPYQDPVVGRCHWCHSKRGATEERSPLSARLFSGIRDGTAPVPHDTGSWLRPSPLAACCGEPSGGLPGGGGARSHLASRCHPLGGAGRTLCWPGCRSTGHTWSSGRHGLSRGSSTHDQSQLAQRPGVPGPPVRD